MDVEKILQKSDEEILAIAHQLRVAYKLKRTLRYNTKRDHNVHSESVAEHIFALIFLAQYFLKVEPIGPSLDAEKVFKILLFHDFAEIKHGDIPTHAKTDADEDREREAAKEIFASLPDPLNKIGLESWQEYEKHTSPEALFAVALDRFEPMFELLDPVNERSVKDLKITFDMHVENKYRAVETFPVMMRFLEVVSQDMRKRGIFWEKEVV